MLERTAIGARLARVDPNLQTHACFQNPNRTRLDLKVTGLFLDLHCLFSGGDTARALDDAEAAVQL